MLGIEQIDESADILAQMSPAQSSDGLADAPADALPAIGGGLLGSILEGVVTNGWSITAITTAPIGTRSVVWSDGAVVVRTVAAAAAERWLAMERAMLDPSSSLYEEWRMRSSWLSMARPSSRLVGRDLPPVELPPNIRREEDDRLPPLLPPGELGGDM